MAARGTIGICGIRAAAAIQVPHAYRADHAVKRHVEIVHDRLQRLGLSVGANESKQCPRRNEHDDRKKSDRNDHFDQRKSFLVVHIHSVLIWPVFSMTMLMRSPRSDSPMMR